MKKVLIEEPFRVSVKRDAQIPTPKEGEALLQVMYCGICGADLASYTGNQPFTTYQPVFIACKTCSKCRQPMPFNSSKTPIEASLEAVTTIYP